MTPHGDARGHLAALDDNGQPVSRTVDGGRQNGLEGVEVVVNGELVGHGLDGMIAARERMVDDTLGAVEAAFVASMAAIALDALDAIDKRLGAMRDDVAACIVFEPLVDDDGLTRQLGELAALLDVARTYAAALRDAQRQPVSEERGD